MDILIDSLIELHITTLVRIKVLISALEEKGIVSKEQIESLHNNLSQAELNDAAKIVRNLFGDIVKDRFTAKS
jgi:hypothetical protein